MTTLIKEHRELKHSKRHKVAQDIKSDIKSSSKKEFQRRESQREWGGYEEKVPSPQVQCLSNAPEWWGQEVGVCVTEARGRSLGLEKVGEVGGGQIMEGFVSKEKEFKLNLFLGQGGSRGTLGQGCCGHRSESE